MKTHIWLVVAVLAWEPAAGANALNPGTMGTNALPAQPGEAPWVPSSWTVALGLAVQSRLAYPSGDAPGAGDVSATLPFRVELPFGGRASLLVEGTPAELWAVSAATQRVWQTPDPYGLTKGDIRIGGKYLVFAGQGRWPAVTLRALTKTTTGKGLEDRRFINAPGYLFDLIFGERLPLPRGLSLDVWTAAGFLAWQQGQFGQNDAPSGSATLRLLLASGAALRVGYRGYRGWQRDDKPHALDVAVELPLQRTLALELSASRNFQDPPATQVGLGFRLGPAPAPP